MIIKTRLKMCDLLITRALINNQIHVVTFPIKGECYFDATLFISMECDFSTLPTPHSVPHDRTTVILFKLPLHIVVK